MTTTFNPNLLSTYQTFYTAKKTDMDNSLTWLINEEKSFGSSEEQGKMIVLLAHFFFEGIKVLEQAVVPTWDYLDWLTQEEYDAIMYKREVLGY